jgi:hypothetical protein
MVTLADQLAQHSRIVSVEDGNDQYWTALGDTSVTTAAEARERYQPEIDSLLATLRSRAV